MRKSSSVSFCLALLASALLGAPGESRSTDFFVATIGSDGNRGTKQKPFATLIRARAAVRQQRAAHPDLPVTVYLRGGTYHLDSSFVLFSADGGDSLAPVTYTAFGAEAVCISGGRSLSGFNVVHDPNVLSRLDPVARGHVVELDLRKAGITHLGEIAPRGFGRRITPSALELFFNDQRMILARWPNSGWTTIADTLSGTRDSMFVYSGDRPRRWGNAADVWLHGYWTWDWADSYVRIGVIDTVGHIIRTRPPHGVYGYTKAKRYYALNLLEELDMPGEYYVDRQKGMLYFWPPAPLEGAHIVASMIESPLVVFKNTSWTTIQRLTLECTRGAGVEIIGGTHNRVAGCTIRNIGTVGVSIGRLDPDLGQATYNNPLYTGDAGTNNGVQSCDIYDCGEGGVILCGGDRATLVPGDNYVDNCHLHDCTQWVHTYRAAVFMWGAGNRVSHNHIHHLPHSAVFFWGNDHVVEYNEVHDVCTETGDAGAFYQGRDWSQRGNTIRYNLFRNLRGVEGQPGFTDVMAVYMDDFASGTTVYGNIFDKAGRSVMIGGGRDNLVENNVFVDGAPAVHVDARGRGWARFMADGKEPVLYDRLRAVHHTSPPYVLRYPRLRNLLNDEPGIPKGNIIRRNISVGGVWRELLDGVNDSLVVFQENWIGQDPGFVSLQQGDYRLKDNSPVLARGFVQIPVKSIGLYRDDYRAAEAKR